MNYRVQTGKGRGRYDRTWTFVSYTEAYRHYSCLLVHSGYKKRLVNMADGEVMLKELT
jgi:hypothetical protein